MTGPPGPAAPDRRAAAEDAVTGLIVERQRGRASASAQPGHTLPIGTRLRDYEITGLIGEGGFGIVYLAWDHSLQRRVAVKEYMPSSMAARVAGSSEIVVKSERHLDTFKAGLRSFVNEARLLARFDHPSLVKVYRFWEENGTAYMVMPYYEGPTLKVALAELGHVPSEAELRAWLKPLLNALTVMHAAQCYHRDIAPDNILLTPRGPLLLDFGAARRVIGDMTHAITVVLKPGYAPIEQYGDVASMTQGAWTDLYALACVVYYAITGKTPMSSVERLMEDRLEPLRVSAAGRYSAAFLGAIDAALAVRPGDRPQTEQQFRALLDADLPSRVSAPGPAAAPVPPLPPPVDAHAQARPDPPDAPEPRYSTVPATLTAELPTQVFARPPVPAPLPIALPPVDLAAATEDVEPTRISEPLPAAAPSRPSAAVLASFAVLALIAIAAAIVWWIVPGSTVQPVPGSAAAASAAPIATMVPAPAASEAAAETTIATPEPQTPPTEAKDETSAATPPPVEAARSPRPQATPAVGATVPAATTATVRPHREPAVVELRPSPPPRAAAVASRCSDILQKASLEPLTAEEAAYLKRDCR